MPTSSFSLFGVWPPRKQWAQLAVRRRRRQCPCSPERLAAERRAAAAEAFKTAAAAASTAAASAATAAAVAAAAQASYQEAAAISAVAKRTARSAQATAARAAAVSLTTAAAVPRLSGRYVLPPAAPSAGVAPAAGARAQPPAKRRGRGFSGGRPPLYPASFPGGGAAAEHVTSVGCAGTNADNDGARSSLARRREHGVDPDMAH